MSFYNVFVDRKGVMYLGTSAWGTHEEISSRMIDEDLRELEIISELNPYALSYRGTVELK